MVEELLRWETPVMGCARVATRDTEIDGFAVSEGEQVMSLLGAANVDEAEFPDGSERRLGSGGQPAPGLRRRHPPLPRLAPRPPRAPRGAAGVAPPDPRLLASSPAWSSTTPPASARSTASRCSSAPKPLAWRTWRVATLIVGDATSNTSGWWPRRSPGARWRSPRPTPGEPAWTDGSTVFLPGDATGADQVRMIGVQASLLAAGSLDPEVVRSLSRRPAARAALPRGGRPPGPRRQRGGAPAVGAAPRRRRRRRRRSTPPRRPSSWPAAAQAIDDSAARASARSTPAGSSPRSTAPRPARAAADAGPATPGTERPRRADRAPGRRRATTSSSVTCSRARSAAGERSDGCFAGC